VYDGALRPRQRPGARLAAVSGTLLGLAAGMLFWALLLGIQVHRAQPGLWTLRAERILACGLDYNGPPWTHNGRVLWLTCGEDRGWKLWPVE
jgi:hypothetical protein